MPAMKKLPKGGRANIRLSVPTELYLAFESVAARLCRSVNQQIERLMREAVTTAAKEGPE